MKRKEGLFNHFLFALKLEVKKIFNTHNRIRRKSKIKKYYKTHEIRKIHFGGGKDKLKGFLNTDIIGKIPINMAKKLPFPTDSVDILFSCHVIEHLYYKKFRAFIKESSRILKEGSLHIIMTPSLTRLIDALYNNKELKSKLLKGHERHKNNYWIIVRLLNRYCLAWKKLVNKIHDNIALIVISFFLGQEQVYRNL